jgi:STE24 endopeptidase
MNEFAIVILFALLLEFCLGLAGNMLNLRVLTTELPASLEGVYKPEEYRKSQQYLRATTNFSIISSSFSLVVLLLFWFSGGFNWLNEIISSLTTITLLSGLLYIGILLFANTLISLPFSIYSTFVIEERFGFNRTTPRIFFLDWIKGLALGVLLGGTLLAGILLLFQYTGSYAWLYCWAGVTIFTLVMQYITPTLIMPLFNKFTPMEPGELREAILGYANAVSFPIKNVFVMDGSKRSSKSNAFFTGFGRNKRIAFFDTLIAKHTVSELVAILAHEVGHYRKKHILQGTIFSILHAGVIFFLLSLFLSNSSLYQAFYMAQQPIYAGLLFFGLLYTPVDMVLSIIMNIFSRKHEYEADRFAAETTDNPFDLVTALKKLSATNLSNLTPHPFYVFLNYSHPPMLQRIQAIQGFSNEKSAIPFDRD